MASRVFFNFLFCNVLFSISLHLAPCLGSPVPLTPTSDGLMGVIWMAPFYSGGAYGIEALDRVLGIAQLAETKVAHHGDQFRTLAMHDMSPETRQRVGQLMLGDVTPAEAVVVCHSQPGTLLFSRTMISCVANVYSALFWLNDCRLSVECF